MAGIFDNVIDLSPVKTTWKIKVKIIRLWISVGDIESIEMVLLDSNVSCFSHDDLKYELLLLCV